MCIRDRFYTFYPQITSPLDGGSLNWQFLVSLPTDATYQIWLWLDFVVLEKKMLTDARRRTPTHSNWSPEWLRWPKKNIEKKNQHWRIQRGLLGSHTFFECNVSKLHRNGERQTLHPLTHNGLDPPPSYTRHISIRIMKVMKVVNVIKD